MDKEISIIATTLTITDSYDRDRWANCDIMEASTPANHSLQSIHQIYDDVVLDADAIHEYNYVSLTKLAEVYLDTQGRIKFDS